MSWQDLTDATQKPLTHCRQPYNLSHRLLCLLALQILRETLKPYKRKRECMVFGCLWTMHLPLPCGRCAAHAHGLRAVWLAGATVPWHVQMTFSMNLQTTLFLLLATAQSMSYRLSACESLFATVPPASQHQLNIFSSTHGAWHTHACAPTNTTFPTMQFQRSWSHIFLS